VIVVEVARHLETHFVLVVVLSMYQLTPEVDATHLF